MSICAYSLQFSSDPEPDARPFPYCLHSWIFRPRTARITLEDTLPSSLANRRRRDSFPRPLGHFLPQIWDIICAVKGTRRRTGKIDTHPRIDFPRAPLPVAAEYDVPRMRRKRPDGRGASILNSWPMKVYVKHETSAVSGQKNDFISVFTTLRKAQEGLVSDLNMDLQYFGADDIEADVDLSGYDIFSLAEGSGGDFDFPATKIYLWKGDKDAPDEYIRYSIEEHELI